MSKPRSERARIHGLYSKLLSEDEQREMAEMSATEMEGEINYLRVVCGRLAQILNENGLKAGDLMPLTESTIRMLNALDLKLNTLLRYIRAYAYLNGAPTEYDRQIEEGEFLARKRRNVFNYLSTGKTSPASHRPSGMGDV